MAFGGEGRQTVYLAAILIAFGMLALFLSIIVGVGMPGLQQRGFLFPDTFTAFAGRQWFGSSSPGLTDQFERISGAART